MSDEKSFVFQIISSPSPIQCAIFSSEFQRFPWSLVFISLTIMYLRVYLLEFILLGVCWASWMCRFVSSIIFEKFLAILQKLFLPPPLFFLFCFWNSYSTYAIIHHSVVQIYQALLIFIHSFFFVLLRLNKFNCLIVMLHADISFCLL